MKNATAIVNALDEPLYELGLDGMVLSATASARTLAGQDPGFPFAELLVARDQSRFGQSFKRIVEGKTPSVKIEVSVVTEGDAVPMEAKLAAINAANGKPTGVGVWLRDLSLEKANEAAANVQGTHLLDLVENITDACVIESADGSVEMVNAAFCGLFGIKDAPQSLVGTSCAGLFETASAATAKRIGPLYFPLDVAANSRDTLEFALADGAVVAQATLAVEAEHGIAGRMHLFHRQDGGKAAPTEGKASDSVVAGQLALIEKIARELAVAYESANIAVHRGEQLELPNQVLDHFRVVERASTSAFDAVAGLLDFSRIEGGPIDLAIAPFRLRESVAAMIAGVVPLSQQRRLRVKVRIEQDVPEQLEGDATRLMQALRNLLECAISSMPMPDKSAERGTEPEERPGEVTLVIAPEYSAEQLIHLAFTIDLRVTSAKPRALTPSATMQLALARQIVRALAEAANEKSRLDVTERKSGVAYQFTAVFPFSGMRVPAPRPTFVTLTALPLLIVSAHSEERRQLAEMAKSWRMVPREADNASVALQLLTRMAEEGSPIPLVITSNQLASQDGFLLAFRIKHHPQLKQTAVIMLATDGKPGDAITCRENGISAYLRQPVAPQQLNEAITAVMGAQDDAEATATLITRHSLREQKKAAVLIIDPAREQAMFAAAGLKKRDFRVVIVATAQEGYEAMVQEHFDVIVVDPIDSGFEASVVESLRSHVGHVAEGRDQPKILCASESPLGENSPYDGMVLKPFAKDSLVNAVVGLIPAAA
jgi:DNA-binding response OmpR family regulator/PAS domain-containing protein